MYNNTNKVSICQKYYVANAKKVIITDQGKRTGSKGINAKVAAVILQ